MGSNCRRELQLALLCAHIRTHTHTHTRTHTHTHTYTHTHTRACDEWTASDGRRATMALQLLLLLLLLLRAAEAESVVLQLWYYGGVSTFNPSGHGPPGHLTGQARPGRGCSQARKRQHVLWPQSAHDGRPWPLPSQAPAGSSGGVEVNWGARALWKGGNQGGGGASEDWGRLRLTRQTQTQTHTQNTRRVAAPVPTSGQQLAMMGSLSLGRGQNGWLLERV